MKENTLTLGSLFDGSGGFPLAGILSGIKPIWASEIEPFPIRVTTRRLPDVRHYGDITKIHGSEIEPVDIITFGSPCQDMSQAGKRDGLGGSRSSLFFEAIRIVKEMREATDGTYPRYLVWENVPGAYSSNKGKDFHAVIQEFVKIKYPESTVPESEKWSGAGLVLAEDFSLAWRTLDAQHWGVPQRRRRIYLVADLDGERAGNILFESEGLPWNSEALPGQRKETSGDSGEGTSQTIPEVMEQHLFRNHAKCCIYDGPLPVADTLVAQYGTGGNNTAFVVEDTPKTLKVRCGKPGGGKGPLIQEDKSATLSTLNDQTLFQPVYSTSKNSYHTEATVDQAGTLVASDYKDPPTVTDPSFGFYPQMKAEGNCFTEEKSPTLVIGTNPGWQNGVLDKGYIVRRLTPTECARLQGFPDWWCSELETKNPSEDEIQFWRDVFLTHSTALGKAAKPKSDNEIRKWLGNPHTDSAEYKMWGNGIALPCARYVLSGIAHYDKEIRNEEICDS